MHASLFVVIPKEKKDTSFAARERVYNYLNDNNFAGGSGRFGGGMADWFVIGGRWSGALTIARLDKAKYKAMEEELGSEHWYTGSGWTEAKRLAQYKAVFDKHFPDFKGDYPAWRNNYAQMGFEDDAQVIDAALAAEYLTRENVRDDYDNGGAVISTDESLECEDVKPEDYIGKYWIVVIDFHS